MAILGVPSTSIVDSTSVGRSLITASDAAAARVIMELAAVDDVTFNSVSAVDGSFSGTLDTEVGGSNRVFNLGSDADVAAGNTEYLETSWDTNLATISAKQTGTGVVRDLNFEGHDGSFSGRVLTNRLENAAGYSYIRVSGGTSSPIKLWRNVAPQGTNSFDMGSAAERFRTVYSTKGDFSGDVIMAANVDFTGLPTSDPVVAGRLWNDSGTMKISAG